MYIMGISKENPMVKKARRRAKQKAFAYLRVSDVSQVKGDGFPRQEKAIRDYAHANGFEIVAVYREKVSGARIWYLRVSVQRSRYSAVTVVLRLRKGWK